MIVRVDIEPGTTLTEEMISSKRLGTGIFPADLERVIGQTAKLKILAEQIITWDMV
ncbi:MAG: SAF domain-containing protein [Nitrospinaceae bacterium]|nr:SAF domain-containing protein [Nitrospinaceae bacterium]